MVSACGFASGAVVLGQSTQVTNMNVEGTAGCGGQRQRPTAQPRATAAILSEQLHLRSVNKEAREVAIALNGVATIQRTAKHNSSERSTCVVPTPNAIGGTKLEVMIEDAADGREDLNRGAKSVFNGRAHRRAQLGVEGELTLALGDPRNHSKVVRTGCLQSGGRGRQGTAEGRGHRKGRAPSRGAGH